MSQFHVGGLSLAVRHCIPRTTHIARHITTRTIIPSLASSSFSHRRSYHHHSSHSPMHSHPPSSSTPTIPSIIRDLTTILKANFPRGFKNFFPKSEEEKEKETSSQPSQSSTGGSGGSPPNNENQPPNPDQDPNKKKSDKNKKDEPFVLDLTTPTSWIVLVSTIGLGLYYYNLVDSLNSNEITFQEFKHGMLEMGKVERVDVVDKNRAIVHLRRDAENGHPQRYYFTIGSIDNFERQMEDAQRNIGIEPKDYIPIKYVAESHTASNITSFLSTMAMFGLIYWFMRNTTKAMGGMMGGGKGGGGRNIFSIGKSPATVIKPGERTKVTFKDVAGLDEAKVEVMEFVEFLKNPGKFTKLGAKVPKGALLVGPPGTGKTLLAKATAGEASVPFFSISGSDFIEMFVGVGPSRVRDLFADARKSAPCIIFIDEIDAVGRARGKGSMGGGHDERENTLNQLLVEMDGFNPTEGIVVLAGTNRKDILDPALLRPGRFDRQIQVDIPDIKGRAQIFVVHLKPIKVDHDRVDLSQRLAALTPGFSGADIANLCNEAALIAARKGKEVVELIDFEAATDRIIGGMEKKFSVMTKQEKRLVAYHEAGHVVSGWFLEHANPVLKVTIVPRSNGALGFAQHLPKELSLYQQEQLLDMMCMTLGGRAAEQVFFDKISTGAADDLNKVTRLAQAQVSMYGMSKRLGNVSYQMDEQQFIKPFSEATAQTIDEEIRNLISISYERTLALIREKRTEVEKLAEKLLEVETVNHDMIVSILGPRPFTTDAYNEYRKNARKDAEEAQKAALADGVKTEENQNESKKKGGPTLRPILDPV